MPSLPGLAFSDKPKEHGRSHLGHWGGTVTEHLGRGQSDCVVAMHLTDVPFFHIFNKVTDASVAEEKYFERNREWMQKQGAYAPLNRPGP